MQENVSRITEKKRMLQIRTDITQNGFLVYVNKKEYEFVYPQLIWRSFPANLQTQLSHTAAFFYTYHLSLINKQVVYDFPPPLLQSMFFHGFMYSYPELVIEFEEEKFKTSELLKQIYNAGYNVKFHGLPYPTIINKPRKLKPKSAILPFSFGKDSLLTFAVAQELGLTVLPFFFVEPTSPIENVNKKRLAKEFKQEFGTTITPIDVGLGYLRQSGGFMLGWDLLLMQYTLLLLPFTYYHKATYFFWSNEKSTNEKTKDSEGFVVNPTFEQSVEWVLHLNNLLRTFNINTKLGTLLEPLHELVILYILHKRYPDMEKYQLSCFNDSVRARTRRWCGVCYECARVYLFLCAIGINPTTGGFIDDMFSLKKKKLYYLFDKRNLETKTFDMLFQSYDERLLAFYLSYKRGVKGDLIGVFQKTLLRYVEAKKQVLFKKYLTVYPTKTISAELLQPTLSIYKEELNKFRQEIGKFVKIND